MACDCRPLCQISQFPAAGVFLSTERSFSSGDGCLPTGLEWPASLHLSSFCASSSGPRQALLLQGHGTHCNCTVLASEGVVSGPSESVARPSCRPAQTERSSQTAPFPPSAPKSLRASVSCLETIQRFAYPVIHQVCRLVQGWGSTAFLIPV